MLSLGLSGPDGRDQPPWKSGDTAVFGAAAMPGPGCVAVTDKEAKRDGEVPAS